MFVSSEEGVLGTQKQWYAVYTMSRSEKKVHARLIEQGIESYLPIVKTLRQWSDRKKWVEKPLLSSYVFVNISRKEFLKVIDIYGAVKFVSFEGRAVAIPNYQIENLKLLINSDAEIESTKLKFKKGERVKVNLGAMNGLTGELVKSGQKRRVLVRIDHINQNLLVNIPASYLTKEN